MEKETPHKLPFLVLSLFIIVKHLNYPLVFIKLDSGLGSLAVGLCIFILTLSSLVLHNVLKEGKYWAFLSALLFIELYNMRFISLNSSYLYKYFVLAFALSFNEDSFDKQKDFWGSSARLLLFIALFFAGLQKAFSPYYREGHLVTNCLMRSGLIHWFFEHFDESFAEKSRLFSQNLHALDNSPEAPPIMGESSLQVLIPRSISLLGSLLSFFSIGLEFGLAFLCLSKKRYQSLLSFGCSLALVIGIYTLVSELLFLALVCLLSYFAHECKGWQSRVYLGCFFYFLIAAAFDYTPFFLS